MALPEALVQASGSRQAARILEFPSGRPLSTPVDQLSDMEAFALIPKELLIGDPLPQAVVDAYVTTMPPDGYDWDEWEFDEPFDRGVIQISSRTLRTPPRNGLDPTRLYTIDSFTANGVRTQYEAETVLIHPDSWSSNRRDYVPNGVVRISAFSSAVDESVEDAEITDYASVQFSYEGNILAHAHLLRSNDGSHLRSNGEIPSIGEIVSFNAQFSPQKGRYKQLAFEGMEKPNKDEQSGAQLPVLPSVRQEGNTAVMTHYGQLYELDGQTVVEAIEIRAPFDVTGLAGFVREQGSYEDDTDSEDDDIGSSDPDTLQEFMPMTQVFKAATQFPVFIKTSIIPVR